jgi:hypothetical protein
LALPAPLCLRFSGTRPTATRLQGPAGPSLRSLAPPVGPERPCARREPADASPSVRSSQAAHPTAPSSTVIRPQLPLAVAAVPIRCCRCCRCCRSDPLLPIAGIPLIPPCDPPLLGGSPSSARPLRGGASGSCPLASVSCCCSSSCRLHPRRRKRQQSVLPPRIETPAEGAAPSDRNASRGCCPLGSKRQQRVLPPRIETPGEPAAPCAPAAACP